jgi:AraC-like DNA-binding protein
MGKTRVAHILGAHALKTIQSGDDERMYCTATDAALYIATAGYLDEANQLLATLWRHGWPHSRNTWLPDQAMEVLWATAGHRPAGVPFAQQSIDAIEVAHRHYMAIDRWGIPLKAGSWQELTGLDLFRRSCRLACPDTYSRMPQAAAEREALLGLDKYLAAYTDDQPTYMFAIATCLAAELAARNGMREQAIAYAQRWAEQYPRHQYILPTMASNRHLAPLLLQGILAERFGVTPDACQTYLRDLQAVVEARMQRGRALVYGTWSWERLLKAVSTQTLAGDSAHFSMLAGSSGWQGQAPASEEALAAAEQRLGITLPADYRAFLGTSNGFAALSSTTPALLPVEQIDYLRHILDAEILAILKEYPGDDMPAIMDSCIQVSERDAEELVLLIPPQAAGEAWQTWFFAHWVPGEIRYPSFRHYLEQVFQDLQASNSA